MDYRERKYLRKQRDARLRVKDEMQKTANVNSSSIRFSHKKEDELSTRVQLVIDGLTKQEMTQKYDTANELNNSQILSQSDRKKIRFNTELNDE